MTHLRVTTSPHAVKAISATWSKFGTGTGAATS
jgi:hypothetical protein